jgi:hypothetical protein
VVSAQPTEMVIHFVADSLSAQRTKLVDKFMADNRDVTMHYTPT